jgi:cytochrome P450
LDGSTEIHIGGKMRESFSSDEESWMTASPDELVVITPEFKADSPRRYAEPRERGPVHRVRLSSGLEGWLVVSHEHARLALTHPDLRKDPAPAREALARANFTANQPGVGIGGQMLEADPPEHTRLRRLVAGAFSPRRTQQLGPRIQEIADELIDAIAPLGSTDLVETFTGPLPVAVISELLGVPEALRADFRSWTTDALSAPAEKQRAASGNLNGMLAALIADKRDEPQDDLLSALVAVRDEDDGRLSETELVGTAVLLVIAGHETTVNLLGNSLFALVRAPGQLAKLRADPSLIGEAVEEFLRFDSSVELTTPRFAAADLELGGQRIAKGEIVVVALPSASHDLRLADGGADDVLDVTRTGVRHLAFGHGIHHCLGAPLARLEAGIALGTLLRRLPGLRPDGSLDEIAWTPGGMMRGPLSLPVRFDSSGGV